jgi:hypothetical protein
MARSLATSELREGEVLLKKDDATACSALQRAIRPEIDP